jgi:hypothetical protein
MFLELPTSLSRYSESLTFGLLQAMSGTAIMARTPYPATPCLFPVTGNSPVDRAVLIDQSVY